MVAHDPVQLVKHWTHSTPAKGHAQIRSLYANVFADERLHATVDRRIVLGSTVVDHERGVLTLQGKPGSDEAIAIDESPTTGSPD